MKTRIILLLSTLLSCTLFFGTETQTNPEKINLVTSDIHNFWIAFDKEISADSFDTYYINKASKGMKGFIPQRIESGEKMERIVKANLDYYRSIRESTYKIEEMKPQMIESFRKLKQIYPKAVFPDVYFVIGAMSSGGTTSSTGLLIGAEMYGLTKNFPKEKLSNWHQQVLQPIEKIPHIVAHESIHFQQNYSGSNTLLYASIKEGAADFIAEMISGKHINHHVHEFANPKEEELWNEFKTKMYDDDFKGWLYSSVEGRPNDLGYWMGYKIVESFYNNHKNSQKAIDEILNISDVDVFLKQSRYSEKFR